MFSMAVAGLVKPLIAVTITLNPAAAHHSPASYTIRPGDTLSQIAARTYGSTADWPALWWANRRQVPDPDLITAGQRLANWPEERLMSSSRSGLKVNSSAATIIRVTAATPIQRAA